MLFALSLLGRFPHVLRDDNGKRSPPSWKESAPVSSDKTRIESEGMVVPKKKRNLKKMIFEAKDYRLLETKNEDVQRIHHYNSTVFEIIMN
jgi:hypothetical protein